VREPVQLSPNYPCSELVVSPCQPARTDPIGRRELGRNHEVAFILPTFVVDKNEHPPSPCLVDQFCHSGHGERHGVGPAPAPACLDTLNRRALLILIFSQPLAEYFLCMLAEWRWWTLNSKAVARY
jgi:hypothetical protein